MPQSICLIEYLASALQCEYLADLHRLDRERKRYMADFIRPLKEEDYSLFQWNDSLEYLVGESTKSTAAEAKELLLRKLSE